MGLAGKKRGRDASTSAVNPAAAAAVRKQAVNASSGGVKGKSGQGSREARWDAAKTHQQAAHADRGQQTRTVPRSGALRSQHGKQVAASSQSNNGSLPAAPQRSKRHKNKFKPEPKPEAELSLASEGAQPNGAKHAGGDSAAQYAFASNESSQAPAAPPLTSEKGWKSKSKRKAGGSAPKLPLSKGSAALQGSEQRAHAASTALLEQQGAVLRRESPQGIPRKGHQSSDALHNPPAGPKGLHSQQNHTGRQNSKQHAQNGHAEHQAVGANGRRAAARKQFEAGMHDSRKEHTNGSGAMPVPAAKVAVPTITAAPLPGTKMSANWAALKAQIAPAGNRKRRREAAEPEETTKAPEAIADTQGLTPVLAVDCEMVGAGAEGSRSLLARVCVVNQAGNVLLDEFVKQKERVTDYRTRFSGIRPADLVGAPSLEAVQAKVAAMFKGRIVVGHSITNDLTALLLSHPRKLIRDTARYPPLMRATAPGRRPKPRALRHLAAQHLALAIQAGEHSPVDDARAALYLYLRFQKEWEHHMAHGTISQLMPPLAGHPGSHGTKRQRTFEELAAADIMVDL